MLTPAKRVTMLLTLIKASQADLVNYDGKIKQLTSNIESWEKHRGKVEDGIRKICVSLDTIPDQVGSAFSALWLHVRQLRFARTT